MRRKVGKVARKPSRRIRKREHGATRINTTGMCIMNTSVQATINEQNTPQKRRTRKWSTVTIFGDAAQRDFESATLCSLPYR